MLCAMEIVKDKKIQIDYFTKEFSGYEIESKWILMRQNPVPTLLQFIKDIDSGNWEPFRVQKAMGNLPVGIRYLELYFYFFGVQKNAQWHQVAMAAKFPGKDLYLLAFKDQCKLFHSNHILLQHLPIIRKEVRKGNWIPQKTMMKELISVESNVEYISKMFRQKCSVYITNTTTYRNFNISADLCYSENRTPLSQVEIEYKGRSGIWHPDYLGIEILKEFRLLHNILIDKYFDILHPTFQTKFNWIVSKSNQRG